MCQFIETICIENGRANKLSYHNERFNQTRQALWPECEWIDLRTIICPPPIDGVLKCRVIYGQSVCKIDYLPYVMRSVQAIRLLQADDIDYHFKSTNREELNRLFELRKDADEILIIKRGLLTDTSIANIALYDGKQWVTPASPLLKGTQRSWLIDKQVIIEKEVFASDLHHYSEITLFNALIDFGKIKLPISSISL